MARNSLRSAARSAGIHMIFLDGVYRPVEGAPPVFQHVPAPTGAELQELVQRIAARTGARSSSGACRYVSRPPFAVERLALTSSGQVRYTLKTPYRDGNAHCAENFLDLMARLAARVPPPRMHLRRFQGVFAPHSKLRAAVTPAHRGVGSKAGPADFDKPITSRHVAISWAQRLKRVFGIQVATCAGCGGRPGRGIQAGLEGERCQGGSGLNVLSAR